MDIKTPIKAFLGMLLLIGSTFFMYNTPTKIYADNLPQTTVAQFEIPAMVSYYATQYGVSQKLANYIAEHESDYNPNEVGDEHITCRQDNQYKGQAVYARGVFQITRCYYPEVTDSQAFDPQYNIQFAMAIIAKGRDTCINQFSTCRAYYRD